MPDTIIPFGPQHPVLPEPIHLQISVVDEVITEVVPALGYVHRGLEKLVEIRDFHQIIQVVERVCGICSMQHAMCYCQGIERMMGIDVPPRAKFLRVIWSELHRMHSHFLWLGLFADSFGFESLFMQFWRIREKIMDIQEATTGNRVIVSVNVMGGLRRDLTSEQMRRMLTELSDVAKELKRLESTLLSDYTVKKRTVGKGVISRDQAVELGLAGPTMRASGVAQDMRMLGYAAFDQLDFEPVVETDGDCWARGKVRFREVLQSIDLIRQAVDKIPGGDIRVKVKGRPEGEAVSRVEQPRGEVFYYLKANGTKQLERLRIRTPTFANIPALLVMLPGMFLSDVPVIVLSIDPCISCTER
ncbi:MAG: nickel-dependent hydrogenase large subunit [Desulfobacterales bacterium]|uniref:Nickel-dependent hydrogenase large subunit n=1 Tax=Candidatus Desulfatibia vada TaxID=2841696 RepID=A0A8J6P3K6_9BACT|nr:nickel-dependent hydrogenase large subunit [Candidatus Desulfatibia vada]MBL6971500.1 nickel-dependent hydrogenase large subunit [Desulfobacterales bacterium]